MGYWKDNGIVEKFCPFFPGSRVVPSAEADSDCDGARNPALRRRANFWRPCDLSS
jgi:hypothetical protein